ncbi:MAG: hypothetical protein A3A98_01270 [Candidatus Staskawiczbacteria bacterium RIFCSPLOWO2_01_FULL_40_39]|uniref:SHS2 domain-containing protein n=1 Tax=Candidatus Staskawiczbacteria bacterium RIFCSPHIGHO2_01_FULL_39_25 TaxID=1802202 RepID=A0A1G2HNP2_9BACT|nr:MAG: hypothetical protein A2730_01270 [Candidatus Staskawiczbacteria bacterium RIFCSPHIGHO2_01_FULL_39_25]OGZ73358.1 MAG: hypothetical protein A3A98_01270 [Candidatus Staskawiczbacteria bacterium RIFCSPLOWO2_01_FULL_40_39]OGZ76875.1 MAG: hypothetical protein A3I87_00480 [Candidatus Staskawiczbacteria bacterium RIFCSPLOWO2_02_FULL_39_8]
MFKFLNLQPEVFGIDINDLSLRIVKLKKKQKGFALVSFNEIEMKPGVVKEGVIQDQQALVEIIKLACNTVKGKKLNTRYVILSLPEEKSFSQVIQMPNMTYEELKLAVLFEAENYIPLAIDKVYLDFQIIDTREEDSSHLHLLINVMPKSIVDSYVSCFKKAGLIPYILELESQAIVRALIKNRGSDSSLIFIDLGGSNTNFIIFSGNSIRFTSSIPISSQQLTSAIAESFNINFDKAETLKTKYGLAGKKENYNIKAITAPVLHDLTTQIKKYINFYKGHVSHEYFSSSGKIEKIILCGGGANLRNLPEFLSDELKIPVELGDPLINIISKKKNGEDIMPRERALSFTTALGLALRGTRNESEI